MAGKVGDRISLDSKKAGQPRREGEILEVTESVSSGSAIRCAGPTVTRATSGPRPAAFRSSH